MHEYQTKCCSQVVKRVVRTIGRGQQFGFEELVSLNKTRLFRAKVVGTGDATCLFIDRKKFFQFMFANDISRYMDICGEYTNFDLEGRSLIADLQEYKARTNSLLDGAKYTPSKNVNNRSQGYPQTWLEHPAFNLHSQACEKRLNQYVKNMRTGSTAEFEKSFIIKQGKPLDPEQKQEYEFNS
jgi:hypothetical protein